jgi:hypothetical protein
VFASTNPRLSPALTLQPFFFWSLRPPLVLVMLVLCLIFSLSMAATKPHIVFRALYSRYKRHHRFMIASHVFLPRLMLFLPRLMLFLMCPSPFSICAYLVSVSSVLGLSEVSCVYESGPSPCPSRTAHPL